MAAGLRRTIQINACVNLSIHGAVHHARERLHPEGMRTRDVQRKVDAMRPEVRQYAARSPRVPVVQKRGVDPATLGSISFVDTDGRQRPKKAFGNDLAQQHRRSVIPAHISTPQSVRRKLTDSLGVRGSGEGKWLLAQNGGWSEPKMAQILAAHFH